MGRSLRLGLTSIGVGLLVFAATSGAIPAASGDNGIVDDGIFAGSAPATSAATLPANFQESIVFSGLTNPTAVRFASDGRVFVAEKGGVIKVFDSLSDTTPTRFADLSDERPQLLGPRAARASRSIPRSRRAALRLRPLRVRRADRRQPAHMGTTACSDSARAQLRTAASSAAASRA